MLKELVNCVAVSGMEEEISLFLEEQVKNICQITQKDGMGNLHAINRGEGPSFLLITYVDEPGVIVTRITDDGYLCFETIGRINPAFLVSKRVSFGETAGVISLKAIHLTTKEEREIPIKSSQLFIDIGASSKDEAAKLIEIGDYGVLDIPYVELNHGFVKGRALAGRMGCAVAIELLKKYPNRNIHVIFATQREIRGIYTPNTEADYLIFLDGMKAKDYMTKNKSVPEAGKGVIIASCQPGGRLSADDVAWKMLAVDEEIPVQIGILTEPNFLSAPMGKNSAMLKIFHSVSLAIPVRYPESVAPIANTEDMNAMLRLTEKYINHVYKEEETCKANTNSLFKMNL